MAGLQDKSVLVVSNGSTVVTTPSSDIIHMEDPFNNLYPAIVQCFVIILCGYIAGRFNLIGKLQGKGIGTYVSTFALPALLFKSMATLNFSEVNWKFLASILIAKAGLFLVVLVFTLILVRPMSYGKAGLYAIFTTQSNDFALGYPIISALYQGTHPNFIEYIYLAAPISLVILNPIGFTMMELEKRKESGEHEKSSNLKLALHVCKGVLLNPLVFMTIIGIIGNFVFNHKLPAVIDDILTVLGQSFSAVALFYLGLSMVGKIQHIGGKALITPILLIVAKLLILPLVTREIVIGLQPSVNRNDTLAYSSYGFLYGTIPTAPSVFLYASTYNLAPETIAAGTVIGTFLSAPLMFVSARVITLPVLDPDMYKDILTITSFDVSILGIVCSVWTMTVMILGRKWRKVPHQFVMMLVIAQSLGCLGMIIWHLIPSNLGWAHYIQFVILLVGVFSSRCMTAMVALALCFLKVRSICFVLRNRICLLFGGFGVPILSTGLLLIFTAGQRTTDNDPSFQYGNPQVEEALTELFNKQFILSAVILFISTILTIVCLVLQHRWDRHHHNYHLLPQNGNTTTKYKSINQEGFDIPSEQETDNEMPQDILGMRQQRQRKSQLEGVCMSLMEGGSSNKVACGSCEQCMKMTTVDVEDIVPDAPKSKSSKAVGSQSSRDSMNSAPERDFREDTCLLSASCSQAQRRECLERVRQYHKDNTAIEEVTLHSDPEADDEYQITRHVVMLLVLLLSMLIGIFLCLWRLFGEYRENISSGVYIEIEFLDSVFNFGQPFIVFAIFGLDTQLIIIPFVKKWRKLIYGVETIHMPSWDELDPEVKHTCEQFNHYHKERCKKELVKDRRFRMRVYRSVFTGEDLVKWLLEVGLAIDTLDAVAYGQKLVLGRVIVHVKAEHNFYNLPYFYKFTDQVEEECENEDDKSR
ncbi:integral membrane protein GPR155 isoform X2 [Lingula anatina]|uniref:Integral membrane protein GPR155 isoform X2 n=1 Tax=Lingula anatina TaxID=7574 RepID=A0A1S3HMT6_LINAN|nr:integral membrane protein GPR155 isoform X2 [Lingula anatina]|eukprot:XP_013387378.1 integral membrane protein GPR155 isoform X2 [Lingula anatina]